jgi:hypothetical protein
MLVLGILMFSQAGLAAGLKKWKDKDGQWHFGDVIPPEYSQSAHEELNKQGMIIEVQPRAKTAAEIAEQKKKEAIAAEKKKQAEEQARHDQILLDTFSSVDDLEMARDGKEAAIKSRISLAEKRIENLQQDLDGRMAAAAAQERSGKTPSKELKKDIDSLHRQIKNQQDFIKEQNQEKDEVRASYTKDINRYKELKSGPMPAENN